MQIVAEARQGGRRLAVWTRAQPIGRRDAALAVAVTAVAFTPGLAELGTLLWSTPHREFDGWAIVLLLAQSLPLAIRHRAPALCLMLTAAAFVVYQALGYRATFASVALYLAIYTAGSRQLRYRWLLVGAGIAAFFVLDWWVRDQGAPDITAFFALPAGVWTVGVWARSRLREQAELQQLEQESAMQAERDRIARELHDVVTHHVTAMVVQADATPYLLDGDRGRVEANLSTISDTGRRALGDLRELLGVLSPAHDSPGAPRTPTAGKLHELVEQTRNVGQPVELIESGARDQLDDAVELAVYRVVQEALTNALKHAPGRRTVVQVQSDVPEQLVVEVTTEGPGPSSPPRLGRPPAPSGRGLDGLRRRVEMVGGQLVAEAGADGSFVVRATLPVEGRAA